METKLQGMETWSTIDPKQDGSGIIDLIPDVTHRHDETAHEIIYIVQADKYLMLCHQKEHISLTRYISEFKASNEIVTGAGGKPVHHQAALNMVCADQGFYLDSLVVD